MDGFLDRTTNPFTKRGRLRLFFRTQRSTEVSGKLNPLQGNAHDTAKRLSLQEVSSNPVLQPLPDLSGTRLPRGRLP